MQIASGLGTTNWGTSSNQRVQNGALETCKRGRRGRGDGRKEGRYCRAEGAGHACVPDWRCHVTCEAPNCMDTLRRFSTNDLRRDTDGCPVRMLSANETFYRSGGSSTARLVALLCNKSVGGAFAVRPQVAKRVKCASYVTVSKRCPWGLLVKHGEAGSRSTYEVSVR